MTAVSPRRPKALVPVLSYVEVECWIIDVTWYPKGEVGTRCTLCGKLLTNAPTALIRCLPDDKQLIAGKSMSERVLRTCRACGDEYGACPFPAEIETKKEPYENQTGNRSRHPRAGNHPRLKV